MTTINNKKSRVISLLFYLLFFFNNETLPNNLCKTINQPVKYVCIALIVCLIYKFINDEWQYDIKILLIYLFFLFFIVIAFLIDSGFTNGYMIMVMSITCSLVVVEYIDFKEFSRLFIKFMEFISVASLFFTYVLKPVLPMATFIFPKVVNSANVVFYNARICYVNVDNSYYRNYGIFREPAVFAVFLILALIIQLVMSRRDEKGYAKRNIIFLITLFTTFSTTGYLAFLMVLLIFIGDYRQKNNTSKKMIYIILFFAVLIYVIVFLMGTIENPFDKFFDKTSSYQYRTDAIISGLKLIFTKPFGYGIQLGLESMKNNYESRRFFNTNTWISLSIFFGMPFCLLNVVGVYGFCKKHLKYTLLFLPIVLLLSGSQLIYNPIFYIISFYGFSSVRVEEVIKTKNENLSDKYMPGFKYR